MLRPNPATAQLNTNDVTDLKTEPEFAGNRGWLSCGVGPTAVTLQSDRGSLFSGHNLLQQPGRLYVEVEIGERPKTPVCSPTDAADMMLLYQKQTSSFPPGRTSETVWYELKQSDVTPCLWFQGFILMESEKCFLGLALYVFISLEGVKGGATLFPTAG